VRDGGDAGFGGDIAEMNRRASLRAGILRETEKQDGEQERGGSDDSQATKCMPYIHSVRGGL